MRIIFILALSVLLGVLGPSGGFASPNTHDLGAEALTALNATRARHGLAALKVSRKLTRAAAAHSRDMQAAGFFSHQGSNGSTIGSRVRKQGYGFCVIAENLAKGQGELDAVLTGWMNSQGHRRNILNPEMRDFGLVRGAGNLWVLVLGRSGC